MGDMSFTKALGMCFLLTAGVLETSNILDWRHKSFYLIGVNINLVFFLRT